MNIALLLGAGAGLMWLTSDGDSPTETPDEKEQEPLRVMVKQVIKDPKTKRRVSESPNPSLYPVERHSFRGEGNDDEEEVEGEGYVNPKREFKSISTDLVNLSFLAHKADVFRFSRLVIDTHAQALKLYAEEKGLKQEQLRFVYKGGNVLRIVANEFLIELPGHASDLINAFYMPYFKRGDADFSIYIDPKLKNFDEVHTELTQLTWLLQQHIRERIETNPHQYFEFFRLNEATQSRLLGHYLDALNAADALKDPTNDLFYGGTFEGVRFEDATAGLPPWGTSKMPDTFIAFDGTSTTSTVTFVPTPDKLHYMRIQHNTALEFGDAAFNLVRTKAIFSTRFQNESGASSVIKLGGELIDVSLPKKGDTGLKHFFETPGAVDNYELKLNGQSLRFLGYSLSFLIDDLDRVLFIQKEKKPWDDSKHVKRLNRLFYLCFVKTFVTFESNTARRNYLRELCERVVTKAFEPDLKKRANRFIAKWNTKGPPGFNRLVKRFANVAVSDKDPSFGEYRKFVELVQRNCVTVLTAFKNIGQYCTKGSMLSEQRIYEGNFNALVPGE